MDQKSKSKEESRPDLNRPIVLKTPELTRRQKIWYYLTCWRPLTKAEGKKFSFMCLKLSEMILNLDRIQKILIKNNNLMLKQLSGQMVAKDMQTGEKKDNKRTGDAYL